MNIKEIAKRIRKTNNSYMLSMSPEIAIEFAKALIAELAKENESSWEEFDSWYAEHGWKYVSSREGAFVVWKAARAITPAVSKIEQETAEACARYVNRFINGDGILNEVWISEIESALRNGEWRKFVKEE